MYVAASFLGAFLLFALQPMLGKAVLPMFGGGTGVWIACMLFFQLVLLAGYGYAHWAATGSRRARFTAIHRGLLLAALAALLPGLATGGAPLLPGPGTPGAGLASPPLAILATLTFAAGLPLLVLSTTAPLVQSAFRLRFPDREPYRLYATSNLGSILGLLTYPFLVEAFVPLKVQAWAGAGLFLLYAGLLARLMRPLDGAVDLEAGSSDEPTLEGARSGLLPWVGLATLGTVWLVSITNQLCTEIASMPLLWIPPLLVFLATFVLAFSGRPVWTGPWPTALVLLWVAGTTLLGSGEALNRLAGGQPGPLVGAVLQVIRPLHGALRQHLLLQTGVALAGLFLVCLWTHGRLAELRPEPRRLTRYYLAIAAGGALGGALVSLAAPLVFRTYLEVPVATAAFAAVVFLALRTANRGARLAGQALAAACLLLALVQVTGHYLETGYRYSRDFFGSNRVWKPHPKLLYLAQGWTLHGIQYLDDPLKPAGYYGEGTGIALAVRTLQARRPALHIGVVGLGVGNVAALARPADRVTFYEISPKVIRMSGPQGDTFSVLRRSPAAVEVVQGDGRLLVERFGRGGGRFDLLLLDAFAGGDIPGHLLTREALQGYLEALREDGLLVLHVSHHLRLDRVAGAGLAELGLSGVEVLHREVVGQDKSGRQAKVEMASVFLVAARRPQALAEGPLLPAASWAFGPAAAADWGPEGEAKRQLGAQVLAGVRPWTDARYSLASLFFY